MTVLKRSTMPRKKILGLPERRILELMEYVIDTGLQKYKRGFFQSIGMLGANNLWQIKNGGKVRLNHIIQACEVYGLDANWFVYEDHTTMMRKKKVSLAYS